MFIITYITLTSFSFGSDMLSSGGGVSSSAGPAMLHEMQSLTSNQVPGLTAVQALSSNSSHVSSSAAAVMAATDPGLIVTLAGQDHGLGVKYNRMAKIVSFEQT